jgi:hypothetical protein
LPGGGLTAAHYQKQFDLQMKIRDKVSEAHDAIARIPGVREQVGSAVEGAKGSPTRRRSPTPPTSSRRS